MPGVISDTDDVQLRSALQPVCVEALQIVAGYVDHLQLLHVVKEVGTESLDLHSTKAQYPQFVVMVGKEASQTVIGMVGPGTSIGESETTQLSQMSQIESGAGEGQVVVAQTQLIQGHWQSMELDALDVVGLGFKGV